MSTLLIACCYWRRANNWGAAAAIVAGAIIPVAFLAAKLIPASKLWAELVGEHYPVILAFAYAAAAMVVGSLLKPTVALNSAAQIAPPGGIR